MFVVLALHAVIGLHVFQSYCTTFEGKYSTFLMNSNVTYKDSQASRCFCKGSSAFFTKPNPRKGTHLTAFPLCHCLSLNLIYNYSAFYIRTAKTWAYTPVQLRFS